MQNQESRTLNREMALEATANPTDYHWKKPVDITTGLWALLWALLLPPVGLLVAIIAMVKGAQSQRMSVTMLGGVSIIVSLAVVGVYIFTFSKTTDQPTISSAALHASSDKYNDSSGLSYYIPRGMKPISDDSSGTVFRFASSQADAVTFSSERYAVNVDQIYPEELQTALSAIKDEKTPDYYLWWGRILPGYQGQNLKIVSTSTKSGVTYLDIELRSPKSLLGQDESSSEPENDRLAVALQTIDDAVVIQSLSYNSYFGIGVIDANNSEWEKIVHNIDYSSDTKSQEE